mgnify:FL=1
MLSPGTLLSFGLNQPSKKFGWSVEPSTDGRQVFDIKMDSSHDALIGMYTIAVQLSSPSSTKTHKMKESFCMIFNPWESKDDVYIAGSFYFVLNVPGVSTIYSLHAYLEHQISQVLRILTTFNFLR